MKANSTAHREAGHSEFTRVGGLWTHAWVRGQGRPLVVVPGLGCASWMYQRVSRELAQERRVYVYDPPGHGWSQGERHLPRRIEELTDHLAAWLQAVGLSQAALFGHSLGGEVILDLAARYPQLVSALVACAPTGVPDNPHITVQLLRLLRDLPRERPGLLTLGFSAYSSCGVRRMYALARDQEKHHTQPLLGRIRAPTLLLEGNRDLVIHAWTIETIERGIPDALSRTIHGGTHALTDSHPRTVARLTLDFLKLTEENRDTDWANKLISGETEQ